MATARHSVPAALRQEVTREIRVCGLKSQPYTVCDIKSLFGELHNFGYAALLFDSHPQAPKHIQTKKTTDKISRWSNIFWRSEADSKVEPQARPREDPLLAQVG